MKTGWDLKGGWEAVSVVALAASVMACGTAIPTTRPPDARSTVVPASTPASNGSASGPLSTVQPSPSLPARATWPAPVLERSLAWHRVGTIDARDVEAAVGFDGGYVAVSRYGGAWFSPDGADWRSVRLPKPLGTTVDVAASRSRLLIVGAMDAPGCDLGSDTGGSCPGIPLSWWSDDGRAWHASEPTEGVDRVAYDEFTSVWAAPTGGWDAAVTTRAGAVTVGAGVWHSARGSRWQPLDPAPPDLEVESVHGGVAARDGDRLVWRGVADPDRNSWVTTVAVSPTGRGWRRTPFDGEGALVTAAAPADPVTGHPWVLVGEDIDTSPAVWVSDALTDWRAVALPTNRGFRSRVDDIVGTMSGDVAVAQSFDGEIGNHETWISRDGQRWVVLPRIGRPGHDFGPGRVAWGPAGILGFGVMPEGDQTGVVVWELR